MQKNILKLFFLLLGTGIIAGCSSMQSSSASRNYEVMGGMGRPSNQSIQSAAFYQGSPATVWGQLQFIPLNQLAAAHPTDPLQKGWINLAMISKQDSTDTSKLVQDLIAWRAAYPSHPGNNLFPSNSTLQNLAAGSNKPQHIAVLLPLSGPLGRQGQVVRDGFLNAFYGAHSKQAISFYNTSTNDNVITQYQKALNDGADFIIGPLTKDQVTALMNQGNISKTTLALNYTDNSLPANLYQFGLAPQDEAVQLADKAHTAGHQQALIIATQSDWGQRVVKTLSSRFEKDGGKVTEVLYVSPQTNLTQAVAKFLHVTPPREGMDAAQDKNQQAMQDERRKDFDVIFLLTNPQTARTVVPLLKFYYTGNTPVYASSSIYSGIASMRDMDLNGVTFCDIPWVIHGTQSGSSGSRLYAVGRDSYLLSENLNRLNQMPNFPVYGSTGALTLTADHKIYRRLPWTQIQNGQS